MVKRIALFVAVAAVLAGALAYSQWRREPAKVSGFIEADEIRVGSRVGGRVARVLVHEGQPVERGKLLVELEPYDLQQRLAQAQSEQAARQAQFDKLSAGFRDEEKGQAQARVDQLAARLAMLEKGPREQEKAAARARLRLAKSQLELAQAQHARNQSLFEDGTITRDEMDQADTALRVAEESSRVREEELDLLLEGTRQEELEQARAELEEARQGLLLATSGYRPEEIAEAQAARAAAAAATRAIEAQLAELVIRAPLDGVVEAIELQPGDLVAATAPVLSLLDTGRLWVRAYVPENRLSLAVGRKLPVSVDGFPGRRFAGRLSFVARQAEFTPGNVQTPEERSKQVFRIKVELEEGVKELRPGMNADVWLD